MRAAASLRKRCRPSCELQNVWASTGEKLPWLAIPAKCESGDLGLPCAKPVNIEIEKGGETHTSVQRRDGDSASPILHVVFIHFQPLGCACRADVAAFECPVKACGHGASQAVILGTALEMTDSISVTIHLMKLLSDIMLCNLIQLSGCGQIYVLVMTAS